MWVGFACHTYAQSTYNGVTLDRGKEPETNCMYIFNDNDDSVRVVIQYKIGNRNTDWIDYPTPQLIPPSILGAQKIGCIDSTIIGLKLVDVIIMKDQNTSVDQQPYRKDQEQGGIWCKIKTWFSKE